MRATALVAAMALSHGALAMPAHSCIRIFEHGVYEGVYEDVCASNPDLYSIAFDNRLSSTEFGTNINSVTFFDETNYEGASLRATANVERMGPLNFNDMASSIHIDFQSLPATAEPHADCVFVYVDGNYSGVAAQFCHDVPDLSRFDFDNKISGIKLGADVARFTVYDYADFAGERRTRDASLDRFGPAPFAFNDRTTSLSFLLYSELPTYLAAIDGCDTANTQVGDICVDVNAEAAVRCCGVEDDNSCDSFCVNPETGLAQNGFLNTYAKALEICTNAGYRLCYREEIEAGSCCGSGCNFDGFNTWINEGCVDSCLANPCQNDGACTNVFDGTFTCECATGWEGETCTEDVDDCDPNPCANGVCTDLGTNAYECACDSGWMGTNCDEDVNDCDPTPCANGGSCTDLGTNAFECACQIGFTGTVCEERTHSPVTDGCKNQNTEVQDECLPKNLLGAVRCCNDDTGICDSYCDANHQLRTYDEAVAICAAAGARLCTRYEIDEGKCCGSGCQFDGHQTWILEDCINNCDPHPCENGGTCFNGRPSFVCQCADGFSGPTCSEYEE